MFIKGQVRNTNLIEIGQGAANETSIDLLP
jgi:hypothetical protein